MKDKAIFIDSNIWLYAFIESGETNKRSLALSIIQKSGIILSAQVINEVSINLIKKANFSEDCISKLVVDFYQKYTVLDINQEVLKNASLLRKKYNLSFWDSQIVSCALLSNTTHLYSEDMQNGLVLNETLTIINPFKA